MLAGTDDVDGEAGRDKPEQEPLLLEALWTYQALDVVGAEAAGVAAASRAIIASAPPPCASSRRGTTGLPNPLELLAPRVADDHPQVRLEAVRALGQMPELARPSWRCGRWIRPMDKYLDYGLWLTLRELEPHWLPALAGRASSTSAAIRGSLLFALQAADSRAVLRPLVDLVRAGKVPATSEDGVLTLIATLGGPPELALVLDRVVAGSSRPIAERTRLLAALEQATRQRNVRPAGDLTRVAAAAERGQRSVCEPSPRAWRACGGWRRPGRSCWNWPAPTRPATPCAQAAVDGLASLGGKSSIEALDATGRRGRVRRPGVAWL